MSNITLLKLRLRETFANLTEMRSKHQKAQRRCHALQKDLDAARKENESMKHFESETQLKIRKFQQIIAEQLIEIRDMKVMPYFGHFYFYDFYRNNWPNHEIHAIFLLAKQPIRFRANQAISQWETLSKMNLLTKASISNRSSTLPVQVRLIVPSGK